MRVLIVFLSLVSFIFASVAEIKAINGSADIVRKLTIIPIKLGTKLENGDAIKTHNNTKLQIVFNDNTVISLGQKTDFKIDDYLFTPKNVKAHFSVTKGIFKSITGRIGKIDKSKFKLKTNNATIGVRGTTFMGNIQEGKESIACTSGAIFIQTPQGDKLVKRGNMTTLLKNKAPSKVEKINIKKLEQFNGVVSKQEDAVDIAEDFASDIADSIADNFGEFTDINMPQNEDAQENPQEDIANPSYEAIEYAALIQIAGSSNPTYSGTVRGKIEDVILGREFDIKNDPHNQINLNFDLNNATVAGNVKFHTNASGMGTSQAKNWNTGISGSVNSSGGFDFQADKHLYSGGGSGVLSGDELQNANGSLDMSHGGFNTKDVTFTATKN